MSGAVGRTDAGGRKLDYILVTLNQTVTSRLSADEPRPLRMTASGLGSKRFGTVGIGDTLEITVFESSTGGLFLPADQGAREGNFVHLPKQDVDGSGDITVPYAGRMRAAGRTPREIEVGIQKALDSRALEPQVIVTVVNRQSDPVTVIGDVGASTHFTLNAGGERLLGALARANGARHEAYETMVSLHRNDYETRALLSDLARDPTQDIWLQPGDTIVVSYEPRYFTALGATGQGTSLGPVNRRFAFEDARLSLAEALAKAGGLQDDRANPKAVFLFRFESRRVLSDLGVSMPAGPGDVVPTVYLADLSAPEGLFEASRTPMRNKDMLFVSNAPATDISKLLNIVLPGASSAAGFNAGLK